ncbi:MAG TPA: TerB family tellurite resistance protein [Steroidobacteraceae bacterium]|nr:TerB family tellurite resistance protein [Steroidobacteraceae bacterium]
MLKALRTFFDQHLAAPPEETHADAERRAQLAAAVLLVEVARSDHTFSDTERESVLASVQRKFHLGPAEARQLLELAELESRTAHDIYQFTSQVDATFSLDEKLRLLEELWRAAYSDKTLHEYEEHLIRRVADLLHLSHSQFIRAKLRVLADSSAKT